MAFFHQTLVGLERRFDPQADLGLITMSSQPSNEYRSMLHGEDQFIFEVRGPKEQNFTLALVGPTFA